MTATSQDMPSKRDEHRPSRPVRAGGSGPLLMAGGVAMFVNSAVLGFVLRESEPYVLSLFNLAGAVLGGMAVGWAIAKRPHR